MKYHMLLILITLICIYNKKKPNRIIHFYIINCIYNIYLLNGEN